MNKRNFILFFVLSVIILSITSCAKFMSKDNELPLPDRKDIGMNIIDSEKNIKFISIDNQDEVFKLKGIVEEKYEKALIVGGLGELEYIEEDGYFQVKDNYINYVDEGGNTIIKDVKGVMINPPKASIKDAYYHMSHYLIEEDVLFILLDGFGYHQYKYAVENGYLPFLGMQPETTKALSVYKPVTNAGLAAIITGKNPIESGIYSRKQRELKVDSIFKFAQDLEKKTMYIEGNIGILQTEIEPVLNLDRNEDGFTDDEVFQSTMDAIEKDYNFIFTHFHGIDDCGHTYGDLSIETMEFIKRVDAYVEDIVSNWKGKVIITADHGMHSTENGGDHGEFRHEDMVVPYIIMDGGNQFEQ